MKIKGINSLNVKTDNQQVLYCHKNNNNGFRHRLILEI